MLQILKDNRKNPLVPSVPNRETSGGISDTAQKIGNDWFDAAIKKDLPCPRPSNQPKKDEDSQTPQPSIDKKKEGEE